MVLNARNGGDLPIELPAERGIANTAHAANLPDRYRIEMEPSRHRSRVKMIDAAHDVGKAFPVRFRQAQLAPVALRDLPSPVVSWSEYTKYSACAAPPPLDGILSSPGARS